MCMKKFINEKIVLINSALSVFFKYLNCEYATGILQMCMKKFDLIL